MRIINKECFECSSMDTVIENGELKCNSCGGYFVYGEKNE